MKSDTDLGEPRMDSSESHLKPLRDAIHHASHLLPIQGPITVFIHHNTLHAFEDLPFEEAVVRGADAFGCEPFLSEDRYRTELRRGRILSGDLHSVLAADLGESRSASVAGLSTRLELRLAMLQHAVWTGPREELNWFVEETDALRKVRPDVSAEAKVQFVAETRRWTMRDLRTRSESEVPTWVSEGFKRTPTREIEAWSVERWEAFSLETVWGACRYGAAKCPPAARKHEPDHRIRNLLLAATGIDADAWANDILIRFCSAFMDQGLSSWPLPDRELGFFKSFLALYRGVEAPLPRLRRLAEEAGRLLDSGVAPLDAALESLAAMGVLENEFEEFVSATFLTLRGWAGMIHQIEQRGDRVAHGIPKGSLDEYLAVRLLLDRISAEHLARDELGFSGRLNELRPRLLERRRAAPTPTVEERAFPVFQLAQVLGWSPGKLGSLTDVQWLELIGEIESFSNVERRRVFHLGYEKRFYAQCLDAVSLHPPFRRPSDEPPRFQVFTCIDEREESFRRHLEEIAPDCETFGYPGFYGVAMYYRGAADSHFVPLCPIIIQPKHWVEEQVDANLAGAHSQRASVRRRFGALTHGLHLASRSFVLGAILTACVGALATIPLVARILFPRLAASTRRRIGRIVTVPGQTRLALERSAAAPGSSGDALGYSVDELTAIGDKILRESGLTGRFARLVLILGHGSHSMNNPHESAHDCGACGGSIGGPNGRAAAWILNDPRVRAGLAKRGIVIPDSTVFVGGLHNTCNEYVKFADKDRIPASHLDLFHEAERAIENTLELNSHERARRFDTSPLSVSPADARRQMDARAEDLAQVRPEWGHATNAMCIVGRRERTRGLFLDRRSFLVSYDPTQDDAESAILARILSAAVPVCAGINLEYYFCHVDSRGYGCGTKLPHNVTSLLGVMDGAASDLRTGLPWQMVEIHEPVRLLFIIESSPEAILGIMDRNPVIGINIRKGWVQLAVLDPHSQAIRMYRNATFEPYQPSESDLPAAKTSADWYRGWRDHLEFAEIGR